MSAQAPSIPQHVAVIMDGNRRWARERGLSPVEGHRVASERMFDIVQAAADRGIAYLTVYAFSTENWKRAQEEVGFLMALLERFVSAQVERLHEAGFRVRFFGSRAGMEAKLARGMERAEALTAANKRATVNVCFNYGGRQEIVEAARRIVHDGVPESAVDQAAIEARLSSAGTPPPDLVIRTGGERRLSNFLLWEVAYAELMFVDTYWPEFGAREIDGALAEYGRRQRRFGA
jgi:undecaprenyl diphosphate synthase